MARAFAEIAFTPAVRAEQARQGSDQGYGKFLSDEAPPANQLGPDEASFIEARDSMFQATAASNGWPYVQHRGGPKGFLQVLDARHLAFLEQRGNKQYLSIGNLATDDRISLILVDYPNQRRLKIWGRARIVEAADDPDLMSSLNQGRSEYELRSSANRAVVITVEALDWNCPKYIPRRFTAEEYTEVLEPLQSELERLRQENKELKAAAAS